MNQGKKTYVAFDQYQRYETVARIINYYRAPMESDVFHILEVGANEHKDMKLFLENDQILFTDVFLTEPMRQDSEFQQADGTALPFKDGSFDFVFAVDVLEHITPERREAFISEACRVAKKCAVLSFPFCTPSVIDAEERVNSYYKAIFGQDFIWLLEHRINGLPKVEEVNHVLDRSGYQYSTFFHGDVRIWEKMWYCHFDTEFSKETLEYRKNIDHYYNCNLYQGDISKNCYRAFYVISRNELGELKSYVSNMWTANSKQKLIFLDTLLQAKQNIHPMFVQNSLKKGTGIRQCKVYFDCGGYTESNAVFFPYSRTRIETGKITVPLGCTEIRFDPVEGYGCVIGNLVAGSNNGFLAVRDGNHERRIDGSYYFKTSDPQLFITIPVGVVWIEINCEVFIFENIFEQKIISNLEASIDLETDKNRNLIVEKENDIAKLTEKYKQETKALAIKNSGEIAALKNDLEQERQQYQEEKSALVAEHDHSIDVLKSNFEIKKEKDIAALKNVFEQEKQQYEEEKNVLVAECRHLEKRRKSMCSELDRCKNELETYKIHYCAAIEQRNRLTVELQESRILCQNYQKSFCWKITKPYRLVSDGIKKILYKSNVGRCFLLGLHSLKVNGFRITWNKTLLHFSKKRQMKVLGERFCLTQDDRLKQEQTQFQNRILFSIIVPLYNTPLNFLQEMIASVQMQTYSNWELCLADGSDEEHEEVKKYCLSLKNKDRRIKYKKLEKNGGISDNTNACIELSTGEYIGLFDHDDLLHPSALYEMMCAIEKENADFLYTDEATFEKVITNIITAHFKPDYAIDTLRGNNYICHFSVFKKTLLDQVGWFRKQYDGSQDHDLILRLTGKAKKVYHIPKLLYYWRSHPASVAADINSKNYAIEAGKQAVKDSVETYGEKVIVESSKAFPTIYRLKYEIKGNPLISILIPCKDHAEDTEACIESILHQSTYKNYEILVIDNGSKENETMLLFKRLEKNTKIKILHWNYPFNYSRINNYAAKNAKGEYLLLLNNDTEVITPEWIEEMLMYAQRKDVGAVGAKLYYEDNTIQHAGIIIGMGADGVAGHAHYRQPKENLGYMGRLYYAQNMSAVTGACMMVKKTLYDKLNGLDESFEVAYNDVDFCMRLRKNGYLNVFTPYAEMYHYESKSRGMEDTEPKKARFQEEVRLFKKRWKMELEKGDPYFNPNFDLTRDDFAIK